MRNLILDSQSFCSQIEIIAKEAVKSSIFDSSSVSDNPKWRRTDFENDFLVRTSNLNDLITLSIFSWYIDPGLGILLRFSIREKINNNFDLELVEYFLNSKGEMLNFLLDTNRWHTRELFGNIFNEKRLKKLIRYKLRPCFKTKKRPKRVQRHRGYRDKGTLRKEEDKHYLVDYRTEQLKLDEARKVHRETIQLLRGFLT